MTTLGGKMNIGQVVDNILSFSTSKAAKMVRTGASIIAVSYITGCANQCGGGCRLNPLEPDTSCPTPVASQPASTPVPTPTYTATPEIPTAPQNVFVSGCGDGNGTSSASWNPNPANQQASYKVYVNGSLYASGITGTSATILGTGNKNINLIASNSRGDSVTSITFQCSNQ